MRIARSILLLLLLCAGLQARANPAVCSNTAARYWWKAHFYDLSVRFDTGSAYIEGDVRLHARVADHPVDSLQIDLPVVYTEPVRSIISGAIFQAGNRVSHLCWLYHTKVP
jgi:hypothetical protein